MASRMLERLRNQKLLSIPHLDALVLKKSAEQKYMCDVHLAIGLDISSQVLAIGSLWQCKAVSLLECRTVPLHSFY